MISEEATRVKRSRMVSTRLSKLNLTSTVEVWCPEVAGLSRHPFRWCSLKLMIDTDKF